MNPNDITRMRDGILLRRNEMLISVQACAPEVFHVLQTRNEDFRRNDYNILTKEAAALSCPVSLTETDESITLATAKMTVTISLEDGTLRFSDAESGKPYAEQPLWKLTPFPLTHTVWNADARITEGSNVDGARANAEGGRVEFLRTAYRAEMPLSFADEEGIYGFGSYEEGYGNLRGKLRYLYQENMRAMVPVLVSSRGYGMLYNCGCAMVFDDADSHTLSFDCVDEADWYFLGGGSHTEVLRGYYLLTGVPPLLPDYAFGYVQSKERYVNADELIAVTEEYRRRKIPLDVIVQDWCTWENGKWGQKSFDRSRYPDPAALTKRLHEDHARLMLSIWPIMTGEGENRTEFQKAGLMLGNQSNYDPFRPEGRALYWKQTKEGLFDYGVDCWWCDCTEPFEADWCVEKPTPEDNRFRLNTDFAKKYLDADRISLYSLYHSMGIYEGMRSSCDRRVVNLTRSSYAGQHRYAAVTWSGDTCADWKTLKRHIAEGVNFTCTGEPYWAFDTGAFFVGERNQWFWKGKYPGGVSDLGYRELYTRWMEYAVFTPMMRSHGTDTPREIWQFGEEGTPFYDAIASAIRLRYTLLPYIRSLGASVTFEAGVLMDHPGLVFPEDARCRDTVDQYLFGRLMVCPVTEPMFWDAGSKPLADAKKSRTVWLPAGIWYDLHTGEAVSGGREFTAEAPLERIPVYVMAGTILPTGPVMQYTGEIGNPEITLTVYPGADGKFTLHFDDGETYAYENGCYARIPLSWDDGSRTLTLGACIGSYPGMPEKRRFLIRTPDGSASVSVDYTGEKMTVSVG